MNKKVKIIVDKLEKEYPDADIQLNYSNPFNLLVATILSAQCTDKRVNKVTDVLFNELKTPLDYIKIPIEKLESLIYSTGFYKTKAKNIKKMSEKILKSYKGKVPDNMDDLLTLSGVGRKTANVVLGHCFKATGIVVDTHVKRLSNRLGLVTSKNPDVIERELVKIVPKQKWTIFTHLLINHGRNVCKSRKPQCENCVLEKTCPKLI